MSRVGSPSTAIRSASNPGASAPMLFSRLSDFAASEVAEVIASSGIWPPSHARNQLVGVPAMRARDGVCSQHELQPRRGDGFFDHRIVQRDGLLHVSETFFGVVADAEKSGFVAQIILEH